MRTKKITTLAAQPSKKESNYNYGEALQKAIMFYEFQRSGKLPSDIRNNWRGDSGLSDGSDAGIDLTGGWYDAGDHVKFNLPMAYSAAMLAWSVYEAEDALKESGQLEYLLKEIKWVTDYLIKCHPSADVFYYQVGNGNTDHSWWGPAEVMQMGRPSYKVDVNSPGSSVSAAAAAALAAAAVIFADRDSSYAKTCIQHAEELFSFADKTKSDSGYTAANGFYTSSSGFYDELSWSCVWLYIATKDSVYLDKAESYVPKWGTESQSTTISYKWAQCWDDVHNGATLLLAKLTGKELYRNSMEMHLDYWTTGYNGSRISYTPKGLAWLDTWGSLRYATTTAFLASVYADWSGCSAKKVETYKNFAKQQIDYALGSSGHSFLVGYGTNSPKRPHHRTAHSSWADSMSVPAYHRHILYGALAGGPDKDDSYTDDINNYVNNEVACDYNAGFVGALAKLYGEYGGDPIADFKAIEEVTNDEYFVEAGINASGSNFIEIKAILNNCSGWPARMGDHLSFKYFVDITGAVKKGYTADDFTITASYNQGAAISRLLPWAEADNIYYVNVDFTKVKIYPGGQSAYKKEIQLRIAAPESMASWDHTNDYSYTGLDGVTSGKVVKTTYIPVYDAGVKVFGNEPGSSSGSSSISPVTATFDKYNPEDVSVTVIYNGNTLDNIKNGTELLVKETDYVVSDNTVTILSSYLAGKSVGKLRLTFDFSGGNDPVFTITITDSSVIPTGDLKVQAYNMNTAETVSSIAAKIRLYNTGTGDVSLSDVKLRYYYTIDGEKDQQFWCDWSSAGTANVTGAFVKMKEKKIGADYYLEIGFNEASGSLSAGKYVELQVRFSKSDWTNYIQTDDYSYQGTGTAYADCDKITAYLAGNLQWGIEP